ncbi:hypothetical protein BN946_scf185041.g3 [Trametes cinnabarina]|uniref:Arrestin C-terminal-like domain-containing protein n=1 Tax=Pycnoporus cinnabarinus TaxID=5643 RepID=A0A060STB2_PYCCI|nr:hypothetical protein BN946_scf185041.g3 [Trametes cinnabarina]
MLPLLEKRPLDLIMLSHFIDHHSRAGRTADISSLKGHIHNWIPDVTLEVEGMEDPLTISPRVNGVFDKKRANWGWNSLWTSRLLIKRSARDKFDKNPERYQDQLRHGRKKSRHKSLPSFLYAEFSGAPEDTAYRCIWTSPESATNEPGIGSTGRASISRMHAIDDMRHILSSEVTWKDQDVRVFNSVKFYAKIVDLLSSVFILAYISYSYVYGTVAMDQDDDELDDNEFEALKMSLATQTRRQRRLQLWHLSRVMGHRHMPYPFSHLVGNVSSPLPVLSGSSSGWCPSTRRSLSPLSCLHPSQSDLACLCLARMLPAFLLMTEESESIIMERQWDTQMQYLIVISGRSFPLGGTMPISIMFMPWTKMKIHRISVLIEERVEYWTQFKRISRTDPINRVSLLALKYPKKDGPVILPLNSNNPDVLRQSPLMEVIDPNDDLGEIVSNLMGPGPWTIRKDLQLPKAGESLHTTHKNHKNNISVLHMLKIIFRVERGDDYAVDSQTGKRKLFDIVVQMPVHILSHLCNPEYISLPPYSQLPDPTTSVPSAAQPALSVLSEDRCPNLRGSLGRDERVSEHVGRRRGGGTSGKTSH